MHLTAPLRARGKTHMFKCSGKLKPICFGFQLLKCHLQYFKHCIFSFFKVKQSEKHLGEPRDVAAGPLSVTAYCRLFGAVMLASLRCDALTPKCCVSLSMSHSSWLQFIPLPNK